MNIIKNIIKNNFSKGVNRKIDFIVIHYTGNIDDTALANRNYFNTEKAESSAHYIVDSKSIIQAVEDKDVAWHCGTKGKYYSTCRNSNSIGIEMCSTKINKNSRKASDSDWYFKEETIKNCVELVKYLKEKYNIKDENIIRHYDATRKICPAPFVHNINKWKEFLNMVNNSTNVPHWADEAVEFFKKKGYLVGDEKGNINIQDYDLKNIVLLYKVLKGEKLI